MNDYNNQRRILQMQIATWYDKENEFENEDSKYLHRPHLERMTDPNHAIQAWCISIERIHTMNEQIREITNARDIRNYSHSTHKQQQFPRKSVDSFQLLLW